MIMLSVQLGGCRSKDIMYKSNIAMRRWQLLACTLCAARTPSPSCSLTSRMHYR